MTLPSSRPMPIIAYPGIPHEHASIERYREFAEAGFTHHLWNLYPDLDAVRKDLAFAKEVGVKLIVGGPGFDANPEEYAKALRDHPALAGYYISDEPPAKDYAKFAAIAKRVLAVDKAHWTSCNLFPTGAAAESLGCATYEEYIDRFLAEVPCQFVSFDHYPFFASSTDTIWYDNLSIVARATRKAKKPMWTFTFSTGCNQYLPTLANLRQEAFTNLAFGAQAIQHFTYWTMAYAGWTWHDAPISADGQQTKTYEMIKQLNQEIAGLSPVFVDSAVEEIGQIGGSIPKGIGPFQAKVPIAGIETQGRGVLVAQLKKGERKFLVLVNRDSTKPLAVKTSFSKGSTVQSVDKHAKLSAIAALEDSATIEPGDIAVYCWPAK